MTNPVEREIKLRFDSPEAARAAVEAIGATLVRTRRLQDDRLLDSADGRLRRKACALRVRTENGVATLAFKDTPQQDSMKVREELETGVTDGSLLLRVFEKLGLNLSFHYQKYREEFECGSIVVAIDETPLGTFVELEGDEDGITELALALERTPEDYIVDSYRALFEKHCEKRGLSTTHMIYDP